MQVILISPKNTRQENLAREFGFTRMGKSLTNYKKTFDEAISGNFLNALAHSGFLSCKILNTP